jgi:RecA-family ATPase
LRTAEGQRNVTLNESAFIMGQYVGGGQISVPEVVEALTKAARIAYKGQNAESEIASVLRLTGGALSAGASTPIYNVDFENVETTDVEHGADDEFLKRLNLVNWKEVWEDTSEEVWFVDGIICAERGHTIYSDPGVGKSLLVREFSACLATGKSVLGLSAKKPIRVLYIDHENIPKTDIRRSLVDMGFTWEELEPNFKLMSFPGFTPFDLPKGGQELKRAIEIINPELVVIDTLSRAIRGKENDNDTWIDFYNYTGKILKSMGIAYIRIDHTGKNSDAGPRGGSAKMGDVDLVWHLKEEVTDKNYRLINEKHRVPLTQLEYKISRELLPLRHQLSGALDWKLYAIRSAKYEKIYKEISNFMDANPAQRTGLNSLFNALKDVCKDLGVSRREFDRAREDYLHIQDKIAEIED